MSETVHDPPEFTDDQLRAALKRVGEEARAQAFAAGRPVMVAQDGRLVLLYADGVHQVVQPVIGQGITSIPPTTTKERTMKNPRHPKGQKSQPQQFPRGWDEERVRKVLTHYESQSEDEAVAEDEAAYEAEGQTVMIVPTDLVPAIRQLIARRRGA
jgi:hypothetical protein